jgi:hypothetical protein
MARLIKYGNRPRRVAEIPTETDLNLRTEPKIFHDIPEMQEHWESHAYSDHITGEPVIPMEKVKRILTENEMLRDELYQKSNTQVQRVAQLFHSISGQSTSDINRITDKMSSRWNIPKGALFTMAYVVLGNFVHIDLSHRPAGQSKLKKIWGMGLLPIVWCIMYSFIELINYFNRLDPTIIKRLVRALASLDKTANKKIPAVIPTITQACKPLTRP